MQDIGEGEMQESERGRERNEKIKDIAREKWQERNKKRRMREKEMDRESERETEKVRENEELSILNPLS